MSNASHEFDVDENAIVERETRKNTIFSLHLRNNFLFETKNEPTKQLRTHGNEHASCEKKSF